MNDILRGSGFRPDTCRRMERVLLVHRSVADCAVFERATRHGDAELIAYVVAPSAFVRAELVQALAASGVPPPAQFVTVGSIPRNQDGSVDAAALLQLPVVDEALTEQLQVQAERLPGIARAACVIGAAPKRLPLHLSALVPDWRFPEAGPRQADPRRVSADDQAYVAGTRRWLMVAPAPRPRRAGGAR